MFRLIRNANYFLGNFNFVLAIDIKHITLTVTTDASY